MAQSRVTEFFANKKSALNPSKRRKVDLSIADECDFVTIGVSKNNSNNARSNIAISSRSKSNNNVSRVSKTSTRVTRSLQRKSAKTSASASSVKQTKITDAFSKNDTDGVIFSETTSTWDEHDGPTSSAEANEKTPSRLRRRDIVLEDVPKESATEPRTHRTAVRRLGRAGASAKSPGKDEEDVDGIRKKEIKTFSAKKCLVMPTTDDISSISVTSTEPEKLTPLPEDLNCLLKDIMFDKKAVSPLPPTPENESTPSKQVPSVPTSPAVKAAMAKCKELGTPSKVKECETKTTREADSHCSSSPQKLTKLSSDELTVDSDNLFLSPAKVSGVKVGKKEPHNEQQSRSPAKRALFSPKSSRKATHTEVRSPAKERDFPEDTEEDRKARPVQSPLKEAKSFYGREDVKLTKLLSSPSKRTSSLEARLQNPLASPRKTPRLVDGTSASPRKLSLSPAKPAVSSPAGTGQARRGSAATSKTSTPVSASADDKGKEAASEGAKDSAQSPEPALTESAPADDGKKQVMSVAELRKRLQKKGKLGEVKKQLQQLKTSISNVRHHGNSQPAAATAAAAEEEEDGGAKTEAASIAPAYQRFSALAAPVPPGLRLPYGYRLLADTFSHLDTAASMLYNRQESTTFSRLKAAVQQMTKRNFEQKMVGQIKTVYPDAYNCAQERVTGGRDRGYELTVTPDLEKTEDTMQEFGQTVDNPASEGMKKFLPAHLIFRKTLFHRNLVSIVKQHHKEFLAKLPVPLNLPEASVTRWHPQFRVDQVPEIPTAPLPAAPILKICRSAADFLQETQGKHRPKVQEALEKLAAAEKSNKSPNVKSATVTKSDVSPKTASPVADNSRFKGIPLSLLHKIQAKEAQRMAASLTRDPTEDRKTAMLSKMPELIRILRSYFVAEKKPALPWNQVVSKLTDSCRAAISAGDVDAHLKLLLELAPDWISTVDVKAGRYIRIDRNIDVQELGKKCGNMARSRR